MKPIYTISVSINDVSYIFMLISSTTKFVIFIQNSKRDLHFVHNPANIYLFQVNNRNTSKRCETCSKLTIETLERHHWRRSDVFIVNFSPLQSNFGATKDA